jgi:L-alanine-DL-glutamate epimerase-like enolase superfamily enzyme
MKISSTIRTLTLKYPFTIARNSHTECSTVFISITHEGITGYGEASPSKYYFGETPQRVMQTCEKAQDVIGDNPYPLQSILDELEKQFPEEPAARAGIDIALHDLVGKLMNQPLCLILGLDPNKTPKTSYTIGIDTLDIMMKKVEESLEYPILKVKVGVPGDIETIAAIRARRPEAIIRVDANTGWDVDEAITKIHQLEAYNIELIEQPIKPKNYEGLKKIRSNVSIPIMADEDSVTSKDLNNLAGCVDAINIKLMKCGGLREALRMVHIAHNLDMKVMFGCMTESSLSLTAAAHLTPLAEYADLDMNLLLTNDPFEGLKVIEGKIKLPNRPGIGVVLAKPK